MTTAEARRAEERILAAVEAGADEAIRSLADLVRIPSLTGAEGAAQAHVAAQLRALGLAVEMWEPDVRDLFAKFPHVAQYPSHWQHDLILPYERLPRYEDLERADLLDVLTYRDRPNVVGRARGTGGGRSLILNGHIDVVTVEPRDRWHHDPFGAEIVDGRMYGRGTSDMKAGIVACLTALRALREAGVRLRGDVIFESVVNEEHAGNGTLACIARGIRADAAIVTEASHGRIRRASCGGVYWGVRVTGRPVSTGNRWKGRSLVGVSAVEKLPRIIDALRALEDEQNETTPHPLYRDHAPFSLVMGQVNGGTYDTATAAECLLRGSVYFSPGIGSVEHVMELMRRAVASAAKGDPWLEENPPRVLFYHHDDAAVLAEDEPIAGAVAGAIETVYGRPAQVVGGTGACDVRHFVNQGKIPAVVCGPGTLGQAHTPDEHIVLADDFLPAIKVLALAINRWCG